MLGPGGWAGRVTQEGCAGWKVQKLKGHRGQGMFLGLGVFGEGDESGREGGLNVTGPCLSS